MANATEGGTSRRVLTNIADKERHMADGDFNSARTPGQSQDWGIHYDATRDRFVIDKALNSVAAVYLITNTITGRRYVGSSSQVGRRLSMHLRGVTSLPIKLDMELYGRQSFEVSILDVVDTLDNLPVMEQIWTANLKPEYNRHRFGGAGHSSRNRSAETRAKLSVAASNRRYSEEEKLRRGAFLKNAAYSRKGIKHSAETKAKMSAAKKGKKLGIPLPPEQVAAQKAGRARRREFQEITSSWMIAVMLCWGVTIS